MRWQQLIEAYECWLDLLSDTCVMIRRFLQGSYGCAVKLYQFARRHTSVNGLFLYLLMKWVESEQFYYCYDLLDGNLLLLWSDGESNGITFVDELCVSYCKLQVKVWTWPGFMQLFFKVNFRSHTRHQFDTEKQTKQSKHSKVSPIYSPSSTSITEIFAEARVWFTDKTTIKIPNQIRKFIDLLASNPEYSFLLGLSSSSKDIKVRDLCTFLSPILTELWVSLNKNTKF